MGTNKFLLHSPTAGYSDFRVMKDMSAACIAGPMKEFRMSCCAIQAAPNQRGCWVRLGVHRTYHLRQLHNVAEGNILLHGEETVSDEDAGYQGIENRPDAKDNPVGALTENECPATRLWSESIRLTILKARDPCPGSRFLTATTYTFYILWL